MGRPPLRTEVGPSRAVTRFLALAFQGGVAGRVDRPAEEGGGRRSAAGDREEASALSISTGAGSN